LFEAVIISRIKYNKPVISFHYGKGINFAVLVLDGIGNLVYHFGIV